MASSRSPSDLPKFSLIGTSETGSEEEPDFLPSTPDSRLHYDEDPNSGLISGTQSTRISEDVGHEALDAYGAEPEDEKTNDSNRRPPFCPRPHLWLWHWIRWLISFVLHKLRSLTRRWLIGVGILLLVNFLWAASSVAVQAVFSGFDKPFFLTFFSTSLFTLFLSGFAFLKSWRDNDRLAEEMARDAAIQTSDQNPLLINDQGSSQSLDSDAQAALIATGDARPRRRKHLTDSQASTSDSIDRFGDLPKAGTLSSTTEALLLEKKVSMRNFASSDDEWSDANSSAPNTADDLSATESSFDARRTLEDQSSTLDDAIESVGEPSEKKELVPIFPVKRVALLALQFLPIWFFANVTFNWSLRGTSVTSNSIISTTSSFWTLLFCHLFKVERFTILRSIALAVTLGGVIIVALSDKNTGKDSLIGDVLAIVSAVCYGLYASFLRIRIKDETQVKMPMFFGFVGFFNMIFMWPFFFILHYTGLEPFELPSLYALLILTLNGLVGTVLSDLLWSLVIFLTSATVATVGLSLNVPFSLILDLVVKHRRFSVPYYSGAVVVLLGFFVANLSQ